MQASNQDLLKTLGSKQPLTILNKWLKKARQIPRLKEPWAMCLSTTNSKKQARSRIVLLKDIKKDQLIFFTNYLSPKGKDLQKNPSASLVFFWPQMGKQIRIFGTVKKTTRKKSMDYWKKRNRDSQLSQYISQQSQKVKDRDALEKQKLLAEKKFKGKSIPCPSQWGGYQLTIKEIEFWQDKKHRLHDRFLFQKKKQTWDCKRLFP